MFAVTGSETPSITLAQGNPTNNIAPTYSPLEPLPCIESSTVRCPGGNGALQTEVNFQQYLQQTFNLLIALSSAAAVFMIVWGGFQYMTTDSWKGKADGLKKAKDALLGLLLILTSFILLRTIDPRLVAIPTTLVKPLNIQYEKNTLFESLAGEINKNAQEWLEKNQAAQAALASSTALLAQSRGSEAEIRAQITALWAQKGYQQNTVDNICNLMRSEPRDEDIYLLCQKLDGAVNSVDSSRNEVEIRTAEAAMSGAVLVCIQTPDRCPVGAIETARSTAVSRLAGQADAIQRVNALAQAAQGSLVILNKGRELGRNKELTPADFGLLLIMRDQQLAGMTDEASKVSLIDTTKRIIVSLKGDPTKVDDGSYIAARERYLACLNRPVYGVVTNNCSGQ